MVRPVSQDDEALLGKFKCSGGAAHENDVDEFIQKSVLYWTFAPGGLVDDPRTLLLLDDAEPSRLVAVAAHMKLTELATRSGPIDGTKAQVVAVELGYRGTRIAGRRVGDLAFEALRDDARRRVPSRGKALAAVVDKANVASLAMCDRQGLTVTVGRSRETVWRVGLL